MNEEAYRREYEIIRSEIAATIDSFYIYLEFNKFASEGGANYDKINRDARVWTINVYALQTAFFVTLGRIFDKSADSHSLYRLLKTTEQHPEFFTKSALADRKTAGRLAPAAVTTFIADAWEPSAGELGCFSAALAPWEKKYQSVYKPIRHKVFAHRDLTVDPQTLFGEALILDIDGLLYSLYDISELLWQLYHNGIKPGFGKRTYDYRPRIEAITRRMLDGLWTS